MSPKSNTVQAFWVGLGSLSSFGLLIFSAAILSRYFEKTEYGTYRQILYVYNTLLFIFTAGLPGVFSYFLPRYPLSHGKAIVDKISVVLFASGVLFSIVLYGCSDAISLALKNPDLSDNLRYFAPIPALLLPTLGLEGIFSAYQKTIYYAAYNIITRSLMLIFIVGPVIVVKPTCQYAVYGWLTGSIVAFILAFFFKHIPFKNVVSQKAALPYKKIFSYSLPIAMASLSWMAIKAADQFYISRWFGPEIFGEFSNGFIGLPFVVMITNASSTVLMPIFSKMAYDNSNFRDITDLLRSTLVKSASIIYPIVMFAFFNAETIITLLYSSAYIGAAKYFKIAIILNLFNIITLAPLLYAAGKTAFYSKINILFALLAWSADYLVVLTFHSPTALAITSVFLSTVKIVVCFVYIAAVFGISLPHFIPFRKIAALILHSGVIAMSVNYTIQRLFPGAPIAGILLSNAIGFLMFIIFTAQMTGLDYFSAAKPIWGKFLNFR